MRVTQLALFTLLVVAAPMAARADEVWLKNGNYLTDKVSRMVNDQLLFETDWGGAITLKWSDVIHLRTEEPLPFLLAKNNKLTGTLDRTEEERVAKIDADLLKGRIRLGTVEAINPPPVKPIKFSGFIRAGGVITDGNTRTREANAAAEMTARSNLLRLFLRGQWNYGEDAKAGDLFKRNTLGEIKMDFFVLERLFVYANALFQSDTFQDLDLRTALGGGMGYQWIEDDALSFFTEIGLSYVVDNRSDEDDQEQLSVRVAWKLTWKIVPRISLFHNGEAYPSVEDEKDVFLNTSTGLKVTIFDGFFSSLQLDFRYDNTPSGDAGRRDLSYILSVGYQF